MSSLLATAGLHVGRRFVLRERTRIGRAADNEVVLADHLVSRYHAEIVRMGAHFNIFDLGSKNGIRVNGLAVSDRRLFRGDVLQVGKTIFAFESPEELRAARFSDVMVRLAAETDSAIVVQGDFTPPPEGRGALEVLRLAGAILDSEGDDLAEVLTRVLAQLMTFHAASGGAILVRSSLGEATPLVARSSGPELVVSSEAVRLAIVESRAAICPALAPAPGPADAPADSPLVSLPGHAICAPLPGRADSLGAVYLARDAGEPFGAADLAWLHALAGLIAGAMRQAIAREQLVLGAPPVDSDPYVGQSPAAQAIREQIRRIAASDATVLVTGETGTGKELVARSIHAAGARANRPFVAIDCSAIPASLMESELFGYEAGAFTGADRLKRGKIEMAEGGTLFLDEVGELLVDLQPKLLRYLEELTFYRVGGLRPIQSDVRVIAATNRRLEAAVREGRFREDLLFRLNVMPIRLPALRERPEDIRALVEYFAPKLATRVGKPFLSLVDDAWPMLERYPWPGNARELRHSLERALILSDDGILRAEHFQLALPELPLEPTTDGARTGAMEQTAPAYALGAGLPLSMAEAEKEAIRRALRYAGGNRQRAAEILNIHRNTLAKKIGEYGIQL